MRPWVGRIPALNETYPDFLLTLIGAAVLILFVTVVGVFTRNLIGMAFFRVLERFIQRIPVVKSVFSTVQQISAVLLREQRQAFQKVVLLEYPRRGLYSLGFITHDAGQDNLMAVFLPTAPNPTSGYMLMVPHADVVAVDIPVEEAIKLIVSGGAIMTAAQAHLIQSASQEFARDGFGSQEERR